VSVQHGPVFLGLLSLHVKELNKGRMQIKELNKRRLQRDKNFPCNSAPRDYLMGSQQTPGPVPGHLCMQRKSKPHARASSAVCCILHAWSLLRYMTVGAYQVLSQDKKDVYLCVFYSFKLYFFIKVSSVLLRVIHLRTLPPCVEVNSSTTMCHMASDLAPLSK
jgi:hypothetical protein